MLPETVSIYRTKFMVFFLSVTVAIVLLVSSAKADLSPEVDFAELYAQIIRSVETGKLETKIRNEARKLNFELQKKISVVEAEIKNLKAKAMNQNADKRNDTLEKLITYGMRKERIYTNYKQRLEELVGAHKQSSADGIPTATNMSPNRPSEKVLFENNVPGDNSSAPERRTIIFESVPEDIATGNFD